MSSRSVYADEILKARWVIVTTKEQEPNCAGNNESTFIDNLKDEIVAVVYRKNFKCHLKFVPNKKFTNFVSIFTLLHAHLTLSFPMGNFPHCQLQENVRYHRYS